MNVCSLNNKKNFQRMGALSIFAGIGHRLWLYGQIGYYIALIVSVIVIGIDLAEEASSKRHSSGNRNSSSGSSSSSSSSSSLDDDVGDAITASFKNASTAVMAVLYVMVGGVALGFIASLIRLIASGCKNTYLWAIFALAHIYMGVSLFLFFGLDAIVIQVGAPICWLLISVTLGFSRNQIFSDYVKAKVVVIVGLAFMTTFYLLITVSESLVTIGAAFGCLFIGVITTDVGYGMGRKADRRSKGNQNKEDVYLIAQQQPTVYGAIPVSYGSVTVVTA